MNKTEMNMIEDSSYEVARALLRHEDVRAPIYCLDRLLEVFDAGIYKELVLNRIFTKDTDSVNCGEHIFVRSNGVYLDYEAFVACADILECYIGEEATSVYTQLAECYDKILRVNEILVNAFRNTSTRELIKLYLYPEAVHWEAGTEDCQINRAKRYSRAELLGRIPLVRLWYSVERQIKRRQRLLSAYKDALKDAVMSYNS